MHAHDTIFLCCPQEVDGNPYDNHSVSYAMVDIEASESRAVLVLEERGER